MRFAYNGIYLYVFEVSKMDRIVERNRPIGLNITKTLFHKNI